MSCIALAGWCSGIFSALKLLKSSSINSLIIISKLDNLSNISGGKSTKSEYLVNEKKDSLQFNKINHFIEVLNTSNTNSEVSKRLGLSERTVYRMKKQLNVKKVDNKWCQS